MTYSRRALASLSTALTSLALATTSTHAQETTARLVRDLNRGPGEYDAGIEWIMPAGKGVVFPRYTTEHGTELWTSNGSPIGTRILKDFTPGPQGSRPSSPVAFGEGLAAKVAFSMSAPADGLWITDGTEKGTVRVFQNDTGAENTSAGAVIATTRGVFFESFLPVYQVPGGLTYRRELLFSDGTPEGTHSLNSIRDDFEPFIYNANSFVTSGQWCYFIANNTQLWRSDGTAAGTELLMAFPDDSLGMIVAGGHLFIPLTSDSGDPELWTYSMTGGEPTRIDPPSKTPWYDIDQIHAAGDKVFLQVEGEWAPELWVSDGTAEGTRMLPIGADPEADWSFGDNIRSWNGSVFFYTYKNGNQELWRSDGTPEGTMVLTTIISGYSYLSFFEGVPAADHFYFWVSDENNLQQLWRTDGTPASTRPVKGVPPVNPHSATTPVAQARSGEVFYIAEEWTSAEGVWKLRGKNGGARRLTSPAKATGNGIALAPRNALPYEMLDGDLLAFVETGTDYELWRMKPDGRRVKSIWKSAPLMKTYATLGFHGTNSRGAIFSVSDTYGIRQTWFTDGTSRGTRRLGDHAINSNVYPNEFVKIGDRWIYTATDRSDSSGLPCLWITDGTPEGTSRLLAADGTAPRPDYGNLVAFENGVAFIGNGTDGKSALWRTDGTASGTIRLKNEWHGQAGERAMNLSVVGGKLHFSVLLATTQVLWQSDGTAAGTAAVDTAATFRNFGISKAFDLGGAAIFPVSQNWPDNRWWRHDATGVYELQDASIGRHFNSQPDYSREQVVAGSLLFYRGRVNSDEELWVTDGTAAGTRQVADINPGGYPNSSEPGQMLAVGNVIYFSAFDPEHGPELWRSDGTAAGTVLVAEVEPGPIGSGVGNLKVMEGKLYFTAYRQDVGREIFCIDLPQ